MRYATPSMERRQIVGSMLQQISIICVCKQEPCICKAT
jgi:hypothetical protein